MTENKGQNVRPAAGMAVGQDFCWESARMRRYRRSFWFWTLVRIPFWFIVVSLVWVTLLKWVPVRVTPLMLRRSVEFVKVDGFHTRQYWKPMKEISREMRIAVIASEDNRFVEHDGFDRKELAKMWKEHSDRGVKIRGCSTISQQTAKNVFTWGSSTWIRKAFEAYWTVLIEKIWGKERILEVYLNVAEMGKGIYGAEAAALEYYGCHAADLNRSQSIAIAVCLPNPIRFNPRVKSSYLSERQAQIRSLIPKLEYPDWVR